MNGLLLSFIDMKTHANPRVETIIDGSISPGVITQAIQTYMEGLQAMAFPKELADTLGITRDLTPLQISFTKRAQQIATLSKEIILQINTRALQLGDPAYRHLQTKDRSLWYTPGQPKPLFGVLVCVDKGISAEAMGIDISNVGRVLAGDIEFAYIRSKHKFYPTASALIKRFIHYGRQGKNILIEPLIEHTTCGRRGQMLANEEAHAEIPSLSFIFDHIDALAAEYPSDKSAVRRLESVQKLWRTLPRRGVSVMPPDKGLFAGIVQKVAQRQALSQLKHDITIVSPIEVYEKETGNLYAGLDRIDVLSNPDVIAAGGFTKEILIRLAKEKHIFSLLPHSKSVYGEIEKAGMLHRGEMTYADLQNNWIPGIARLVDVTETLWTLYMKKSSAVRTMIREYFRAWKNAPADDHNAIDRRVIHHLFHVVAYAFLLDTLENGNYPGMHHIEHYLATGDHEIGSKPLIALGQGDLDRPSASEMFTGYSVLLHSNPGHDGTPIPVVMKLDTDRTGDKPMSTEETNVAFDDLREFFNLWPYFLVGDMIPILMVRGKHMGGVSRLGLSIIRSLGDMCTLLEQSETLLPRFVPANNSQGEVVLVPSIKVIEQGLAAGTDLKKFRSLMPKLADDHSDPAIQQAYLATHGILRTRSHHT